MDYVVAELNTFAYQNVSIKKCLGFYDKMCIFIMCTALSRDYIHIVEVLFSSLKKAF